MIQTHFDFLCNHHNCHFVTLALLAYGHHQLAKPEKAKGKNTKKNSLDTLYHKSWWLNLYDSTRILITFPNAARSEGKIMMSGMESMCKASEETDKSKGKPGAAGKSG